MFTGLVQSRGSVAEIQPTPNGVRLLVHPAGWVHRPIHGESICVSGVCLTHASHDPCVLSFDVVRETLDKTTLGRLKPGDPVNLEHSCRADTLLGGHIVQGHTDGVATILRSTNDPADWRLTIQPPYELMDYIVPKGSVALDGVSLTIAAAAVGDRTFEVALIPTTLELTTLGIRQPGDQLNIETDILSKTVVHWLERQRAR